MIIPSCLEAGEAVISGITDLRNLSDCASPAGAPVVHGVSEPLSQASGAM